MTVSYNLDVSSVSAFSFFKLLFRWRGSIWKSVHGELILWLICYYIVYAIYRLVLTHEQRVVFDTIAQMCESQLPNVPLTFMLGFFVTIIVDRWRQIFNNMGWIENAAMTVSTVMRGDDMETVLQRRAIVRYMVLTQVLVFRDISMRVRRRFPNMDAIEKAGFILPHETKWYNELDIKYNKYWAPINWALSICAEAHAKGKIDAPPSFNNVIGEIRTFRANLALLCNYDWVPIPIAYPQVVFLAVRVYFIICLVCRQHLIAVPVKGPSMDLYVPFLTILQFLFIVGWMKVAEALLNPLGEDDDDFECNFLIDKNIATGMAIVDQTHNFYPHLEQDLFMDKDFVPKYSEESTKTGHDGALVGSAAQVTLAEPTEEVKMVSVEPQQSQNDMTGPDADREKNGFTGARTRSTTGNMRRRFSTALNLKKGRSQSVQPVDLGISLPSNFNLTPERAEPHSPFKLSFQEEMSPKSVRSGGHTLSKVDEEEDKSRSNSQRSTVEENEERDEEVHDIIKNELPPRKHIP